MTLCNALFIWYRKVETQSEFDRLFHSSNTKEIFPKEHDEIEKPFICPVHGACPADSYPSLSNPSLFEDISSPQKLICEHPECRFSKVSSIVNMDNMKRNSPSDFLKRKSKLTTKRKMDRNAQLHSPDLKVQEIFSKCLSPHQLFFFYYLKDETSWALSFSIETSLQELNFQ